MVAAVAVAESTMVSCAFGRQAEEEGETDGFFRDCIVEVVEGVRLKMRT
jgi:hypothetical protein